MIITALDFNTAKEALALSERIDPTLSRLKVGKELFTIAGPQLVESLQRNGFDVFLDLKFHDIPNTVAGALRACASMGVWMVNVHAAGGPRMLSAARDTIPALGESGTKLIAVTVLTSMDDTELQHVGVQASAKAQVELLAKVTIECGLDGVVCSPQEVSLINSFAPESFLTVTPGVRPAFAQVAGDDQMRVMTPAQAIQAGSRYLVIGRPVTQAKDPLKALQLIHDEIKA